MIIVPICGACGNLLTEEEEEFYVFRCEACERDWNERINAWRSGGHDPELDSVHSFISVTH